MRIDDVVSRPVETCRGTGTAIAMVWCGTELHIYLEAEAFAAMPMFSCPACNKTLDYDVSPMGLVIRCRFCGTRVRTPAIETGGPDGDRLPAEPDETDRLRRHGR